MNDIDELLRKIAKKDVDVPQRVSNVIRQAVRTNKRKNVFWVQRLITAMASVLVIFIGGITVYSACGGTFYGKPISEWLGIVFSDEYEEYRVTVEDENIEKDGTSVELISTVCDDGFVVLEFDVVLSNKDREYLEVGEPILNESSIEKIKQERGEDELDVFQRLYGEQINELGISFNNDIVEDEYGKRIDGLNNYNLIIDGEEYWVRPRAPQTTTQISENEFKVYQLYFLTDKELGDKTEFTITLKDVALKNCAKGGIEQKFIFLDNEFNIELSKDKAIKNSKEFVPVCENSVYKNMTKKVEKVIETPLQTIVKIDSVINNLSLSNLCNTSDKNYIGLCNYKVYDENGNELTSCSYETNRVITYADGSVEQWEVGDIGTYKDFKNATLNLTEYIIVEKKDETESLEIVPIFEQPSNNVVEKVEGNSFNFGLE